MSRELIPVEVTQEDIDAGTPMDTCACAFARAACRALGVDQGKLSCGSIALWVFSDAPTRQNETYRLTEGATRFIRAADCAGTYEYCEEAKPGIYYIYKDGDYSGSLGMVGSSRGDGGDQGTK